MPIKISAVECAACQTLIPEHNEHILINEINVVQIPGQDASDWKKKRPSKMDHKDVVVCDLNCLARLLGNWTSPYE